MKKLPIILFIFILPSLIFSQEQRIALVIGNSNYQFSGSLDNPVNDANDIASQLKSTGFQVKKYIDLDQVSMKRVIDEFGESLNSAKVGLFFFAGHGVQAKGRNYLIPVDAALKTENDVEYNCVDARRILGKMEDAGTRTNIVILDACRNNPFERSWSRNSNGNGLAFMNAPSGSLIAYSTAPGKTASDGYDRNSPYTAGLLEYISTPNLKIEDLFKLVRIKVMDETNEQQQPWESTSLRGDFYFNTDQDKTQTKLSDILPVPKETLNQFTDYESHRQTLAAGIRSIAILPFTNITGDESKVYLAAGMHDALISELSQLGSVRVISKTSTLKYADFQNTIQEVATELNVDGVIETSLISIGENLRIQVKLYSAFPQEQMLWSEVFTSKMSDILYLYNQLPNNIAPELPSSPTPEQEADQQETITVNMEAYDLFLKSYQFFGDLGEKSLREALDYLTSAIELEPTWAPLYSGMAHVWMGLQQAGHESPRVAGPKIYEYANKALELDPQSAEAHHLIAMAAYVVEWDWLKAENEFLAATTLNPSNALSRSYYSQILFFLQKTEEASKQARLAYELDPFNPMIKAMYAVALLFEHNSVDALSVIEELLSVAPENAFANNILEKAAFQCDEYEKAIKAAKYHIPLEEESFIEAEKIFKERGFIAAYTEILRQLEVEMLNDFIIHPVTLASKYHMVKQYDKAMDWIEKGYEIHDPNMPLILTGYYNFEHLYDNPRFIAIAKKINLPLPIK